MILRMLDKTVIGLFVGLLFASSGATSTELPANWKRKAVQGNALEMEKEKGDFEISARRFLETARAVDEEINGTVEREINRRKNFIRQGYERLVTDIDLSQRELRLEAIRNLEAFVRKYPDHDIHTPDALFRLAELYYEKSAVDYSVAMDVYDEAVARFEAGKAGKEPEQPYQNFTQTVRVYEMLRTQYPDYRYADAALYLLGYVLDASGDMRKALAVFKDLTEKYPSSTFLPETYLRIGEYHFDAFEWEEALAAYRAALAFPESKFYDKAIYKLAWTYFQKFDYDNAIETFKNLIRHYDKVAQGATDKSLAQALRAEAVDYLARSLAEDDWDGDGEPDEEAGVERAVSYLSEGEEFERDILKGYAKSLYELHEKERYADAVQVFGLLIERNPLDAENPSLQEKVIAILDIMGEREKASNERDRLITQFNPGSNWYISNRANGKATAEADELVELAMRQQAQLHHQAAQGFKKRAAVENNPGLLANAAAEYQKAAAGYQRYLDSYGVSKYAYDMRYFLGETLFFSGQFEQAAEAYIAVRDTLGFSKHREDAGFSAIKSLESEIDLRVEERRLPPRARPSGEEVAQEEADTGGAEQRSSEIRRVQGDELEPLVQKWLDQVDAYVESDLSRPDDPNARGELVYQAADLLHRYKRYEESRPRLERIIDEFPKTRIAGYAAAHLINSYKEENDWAAIEKWAAIIAEKEIGLAEDQARLQEEIQVFKLGSQFQYAEQLLEEKRYLEAAKEFERIVNEDSRENLTFADKALYNAALAYQEIAYYDSAARLYERIITETRFKNSEFTEDVLFRLAENHKLFFNFGEAVDTYLALVSRNPDNKNSPYSLFEAARLLENDGRKAEAAKQYERYSTVYPKREDAAALLFRAGTLWADLGKSSEANGIFEGFIQRFEMVESAAELVVHARLKIAEYLNKKGRDTAAQNAYTLVIADFNAKGFQPGSLPASYAAQAQFALVEYRYREYERIKLKGSVNQMGRQIQEKEKLLKELQKTYVEVFPYKSFDWTFAAYFRIGKIFADFAEMLYEAPVPSSLSEEDQEIYQMELEDVGVEYEDTAVERYEIAVMKAAELKVRNEWTMRALRAVNQYKPEEYPLLREARRPAPLSALTSQVGAGSASSPGPEEPSSPELDTEVKPIVPSAENPSKTSGQGDVPSVPPANGGKDE